MSSIEATDNIEVLQAGENPRKEGKNDKKTKSTEKAAENASSLSRWYLLPFYVGQHIGNLNGPVKQDGFWASLSTFILVFSIGFSVTIAKYLTTNNGEHSLTQSTKEIVYIFFMLAACVIMKKMVQYTDSLGEVSAEDEDEDDDEESDGDTEDIVEEAEYTNGGALNILQRAIKDRLPIIGIGFFFILGIYMDITQILAHFNCMYYYYHCCYDYMYNVWVSILFHVNRMVYSALALVFTIQFQGMHFHRSVSVHYGLLSLAAVTLILWFDTIIHDFTEVFQKDEGLPSLHNGTLCKNLLLPNDTDTKRLKCMENKTGLYKVAEDMAPYFYPVTIEFSLLVCE